MGEIGSGCAFLASLMKHSVPNFSKPVPPDIFSPCFSNKGKGYYTFFLNSRTVSGLIPKTIPPDVTLPLARRKGFRHTRAKSGGLARFTWGHLITRTRVPRFAVLPHTSGLQDMSQQAHIRTIVERVLTAKDSELLRVDGSPGYRPDSTGDRLELNLMSTRLNPCVSQGSEIRDNAMDRRIARKRENLKRSIGQEVKQMMSSSIHFDDQSSCSSDIDSPDRRKRSREYQDDWRKRTKWEEPATLGVPRQSKSQEFQC
eukprot:1353355-Amorphochlora_amoeboformis.AAC.2